MKEALYSIYKSNKFINSIITQYILLIVLIIAVQITYISSLTVSDCKFYEIFDLETQKCTSCKETNTYYYAGQCKSFCPTGYDIIKDINYCYRCTNLNNYFYRGSCDYTSCPSETIKNDTSRICSECIWNDKYYYSGNCVTTCDVGLIPNIETHVCGNCKEQGLFYFNGECISSCPQGTYISASDTNTCMFCYEQGKYYDISTDKCRSSCSSGQFKDWHNFRCLDNCLDYDMYQEGQYCVSSCDAFSLSIDETNKICHGCYADNQLNSTIKPYWKNNFCVDSCETPLIVANGVCVTNTTLICSSYKYCNKDSSCEMINTSLYHCVCDTSKDQYGKYCNKTLTEYLDDFSKIKSFLNKFSQVTVLASLKETTIYSELKDISLLIVNSTELHKTIYTDYGFTDKILSFYDQTFSNNNFKDISKADVLIFFEIVDAIVSIDKTLIYENSITLNSVNEHIRYLYRFMNIMVLNYFEVYDDTLNYDYIRKDNYYIYLFSNTYSNYNRYAFDSVFFSAIELSNCALSESGDKLIMYFEIEIDLTSLYKEQPAYEFKSFSFPINFSMLDGNGVVGIDNCSFLIYFKGEDRQDFWVTTYMDLANSLKTNSDINLYDINDDYFSNDCYFYTSNDTYTNLTVTERVKNYYKNASMVCGMYDINNKVDEYVKCKLKGIKRNFFICDCSYIPKDNMLFLYFKEEFYNDNQSYKILNSVWFCFRIGLSFPDSLHNIWFFIVNLFLILEITGIISHFLSFENSFENEYYNIAYYDLDYFMFFLVPSLNIQMDIRIENSDWLNRLNEQEILVDKNKKLSISYYHANNNEEVFTNSKNNNKIKSVNDSHKNEGSYLVNLEDNNNTEFKVNKKYNERRMR